MKKPIIGITMDSEDPGGYSNMPWYALRQNYADVITQSGGMPIALPHDPELTADYLELLDGLVITGGAFDVDPAMFGAASRHSTVITKDKRTTFEKNMTEAMLSADKPVLGICGGQQLMHVILGGTLIQHIPDEVTSEIAHEQPNPRTEAGHDVKVTEGTLLHKIVGTTRMPVNSAHHQAAKDYPDNIIINAMADDGVIEGIEDNRYRFCLGVQWHPEYLISDGDRKIMNAFVQEAARDQ
ncbi:MAG: gamma-glutamyl-gamma-aminobutyrate hydrolase family protein [Sneathiella sp.]